MVSPLSNKTVFATLIKREFVEQRVVFLLFPLLGTALAMLLYAYLFASAAWSNELPAPMDKALFFVTQRSRDLYLTSMYALSLRLMMTCYWLAMLYYFLMTLYQQRKDRSVLFWNSLPVSDTQMVLSKLVAGLVCSQAVYLACYVVLALFLMLVSLVYGMYSNGNWDIGLSWSSMVAPAELPTMLASVLLSLPLTILWALPVYGWCLLVSARVRQTPLLWAIAPIVLLFVVELVLGGWLGSGRPRPVMVQVITARGSPVLLDTVTWHAVPLPLLDSDSSRDYFNFSMSVTSYPWGEFLAGIVLGVMFIYAAIRFNRPDEN